MTKSFQVVGLAFLQHFHSAQNSRYEEAPKMPVFNTLVRNSCKFVNVQKSVHFQFVI